MGSMRLQCPLCCTERFSSPSALKYHLLSIIDNLLCTICGKKFINIHSLAEHISSCCFENGDKEEEKTEDSNSLKEDEEEPELEDEIFYEDSETRLTNEDELMQVDGDASSEEKSEQVTEEKQEVLEEEQETEEELYYCSSCDFSFNNFEKHIEEHHNGQEIYIDNREEETVEPAEAEAKSEVFLVDGSEVQEEEVTELHTLEVKECTDNSGRAYTRKVVQIAKFWDENEDNPNNHVDTKLKNTRPDPEIQYFIVKEGVAERVEKDAANTEEDVVQVFQCPVCSVHFIKERQYQLHKCTKMKFQCTECDASFPHSRSLSAHMRMHRDRKTKTELQNMPEANGPFICEHCNTQFGTYKSLRLHIRMHDPVKSKEIEPPVNYGIMGEDIEAKSNTRTMFTCKICNKVYDEGYKDIHLLSHSTKNNYDCTICNRKFFTESNLDMHLRVHNTEKTQTCTYCKKEFDDPALLQQHVKQHIESRPYECSYCNRRFIRPHEKVKHERIHTGEKPHICELCGKAFRVSYCLTLHMRTHSGSRPYQCQECGKRFKAHSVYNHHLLIHSNVRKYKCPYCPKAFKTAVQLAGHRNTHTKPFTCTECNRPFASLYAVRSHMETHKQDNNLKYNCYACGASYARAFALRDHIKSHHEDQWDKDYDPMIESSSATTSILQDEDGNEIENVFIVDSNTIVDIPQQDVIIEQN